MSILTQITLIHVNNNEGKMGGDWDIQCEDVQPASDHPGSCLYQTRNQSPKKKNGDIY